MPSIAFGLFVVGQWLVVFTRVNRESGAEAAWTATLWDAVVVVAGVAIMFAVASIVGLASTRRDERIRSARPDAIVLSGSRNPQLKRAFTKGLAKRAEDSPEMFFPASISVVADEKGLELWGGLQIPRQLFGTSWSEVAAIRSADIAGTGKLFRGIVFVVRSKDVEVELPVIIVGRGFGKLFPEHADVIASRVQQLERLRHSIADKAC
jgi:hypothetical protein